jgi:hypothetical protein
MEAWRSEELPELAEGDYLVGINWTGRGRGWVTGAVAVTGAVCSGGWPPARGRELPSSRCRRSGARACSPYRSGDRVYRFDIRMQGGPHEEKVFFEFG